MDGIRADSVLVSGRSLLAAAEPDADAAAAAAALNNKSMKDWAITMQIIEINMFGGGKPSCKKKAPGYFSYPHLIHTKYSKT